MIKINLRVGWPELIRDMRGGGGGGGGGVPGNPGNPPSLRAWAHITRKDCPRKQKGLFCPYDLTIKNYRPVQANHAWGRVEASLTSRFS